jgi:hypothetical protein
MIALKLTPMGDSGFVSGFTGVSSRPLWSRDGTSLYYRSDSHVMADAHRAHAGTRRRVGTRLFSDVYERQRARNFDLLHTGEFVGVRSDSPPGALNVVINCDRRLKRR